MNMPVKDTEFMKDIEAANHMVPSVMANTMLISITGFVVWFFIWASFSEVEQLTRGQGQVIPSREIQVIQSLEGGILQELLVQEGDIVEKDQVLLRISDVMFASEERGVEARSIGLRAKKARLEAEAEGKEFVLLDDIRQDAPQIAANEEALYRSRQREFQNALAIFDDKISGANADLREVEAKISRLSGNLSSLRKELNITEDLVKKRAVPELEAIRLRRQVDDISGQISEARQQKASLEAQLRAARKQKDDQDSKFRSQALGELNAVETEIAAMDESLTAIEDRVFRTEIRSPARGIVNKIAIKTIGGVIEPAMRLVEVVPLDDELKIKAKVLPSEIAFLEPGQNVNVKITAYDPQVYGSLDGELVRIGANSVTDRDGNIFFEVEVRTQKNYMGSAEKPLPITPGMVAAVEVVTGKRTILDYLAKPFLKARSVALTER